MSRIAAEHRAWLEALFAAHRTWVVATARDGLPWISGSFFAPHWTPDGELCFYCAFRCNSYKLATLRLNPQAAVYVGPDRPTRWLQAGVVGTVLADAVERNRGLAFLLAHAPAAGPFLATGQIEVVRFQPTRLNLRDLTVSPRLRVDLELHG